MMHTYVLPISDGEFAWIETYHAPTLEEVKDKIIREFIDNKGYDITDLSYEEFSSELKDYSIIIGDPEDIECLE